MDGYVYVTPQNKIVSIVKDLHMRTTPPEEAAAALQSQPFSYTTTVKRGSGCTVKVSKCTGNNEKKKINKKGKGKDSNNRDDDNNNNDDDNDIVKNYSTFFYSLVHPPTDDGPKCKSFTLVHHDGITGPDEISRFCRVDDMIAQIAAAIPLMPEPRVIMQAPALGTLFGRRLEGPAADLIKQTFLQLAQQAGSDMYGRPIRVTDQLAELLMLSEQDPKGPICLGRLADGIAGYRQRENGTRALIFVSNCQEFHQNSPNPVSRSDLHLYGMQYVGHELSSPRIFVSSVGDSNSYGGCGATPCPFGTPLVILQQMTVQNVLNLVEFAIRNYGRNSIGGDNFHQVCWNQAAKNVYDGSLHPFARKVSKEILKSPPNSVNNSQLQLSVHLNGCDAE